MLNSKSVFLVSGGAKGVTAECVIRLAKQYRCKFILLGRSSIDGAEPTWAQGCTNEAELKKRAMADLLGRGEKPTPQAVQKTFKAIMSRREIEQTLQAISQAGGQVTYLSVDVTDRQALLQQLPHVTQKTGAITAILHGAGVLADKPIEKKTEQDFEAVYSTKVAGLETLLQCVPPSQLTHLILFSSVAGFYGNVGQADYAMANEILNKSAYLFKQQYPHCHVVSINWGPWDGGMVTPELKKAFAERNIEVIPIPVGTKMLVDELNGAQRHSVQILVGNELTGQPGAVNVKLQPHRLRRHLTQAANPFLVDHVISTHPVLPTACAASWIANACEQLYPGYIFTRFDNLQVFKGIIFDDTLADEYVLDLKPLSTELGAEIAFEGLVQSYDKQGRLRSHYTAQVTLRQTSATSPVAEKFNNFDLTEQPDQAISKEVIYKAKALFHGPAFQGVERVLNMTLERSTMRCRVPELTEQRQGQFPVQTLNPYLIDVPFQAMVIWVGLLKQLGCLPLQCQRGECFRDLTFGQPFYLTMLVRQCTDFNLTTDMIAHDINGEIYFRLTGAKVTISKSLYEIRQTAPK